MKEHFKGEEEIANRSRDWKNRAENWEVVVTPFLNPREQEVLRIIVGKDLQIKSFSHIKNAERCRMVIAHRDEKIKREDFKVSLLKGTYKNDWFKIGHRDVMGAVLNSGIKSSVMGEIVVNETDFYIEVANTMEDFIKDNVGLIGKAKIVYKVVDEEVEKNESIKTTHVHLSSLRLDNVIASTLNLSRSATKDLFSSNLVSYNFKPTKDFSIMCDKENMMVSIRGYGRFLIMHHKIKQNGRYLLIVGKYN